MQRNYENQIYTTCSKLILDLQSNGYTDRARKGKIIQLLQQVRDNYQNMPKTSIEIIINLALKELE